MPIIVGLMWLVVAVAVVGFISWLVSELRKPTPEVNRTEEWEQERREVVALKRGERP